MRKGKEEGDQRDKEDGGRTEENKGAKEVGKIRKEEEAADVGLKRGKTNREGRKGDKGVKKVRQI